MQLLTQAEYGKSTVRREILYTDYAKFKKQVKECDTVNGIKHAL